MATKSRALEVTVISGEGLRMGRKQPVKKNAYVTVGTDSNNCQTTRMDREGGSHPAWNEKLFLELPAHARFLTVEVKCRTYSGDMVVGTASIPASDFSGGYFPENYLHFLSYRLRDGKGERNGIINLSVKVKVPENCAAADTYATAASCSQAWLGVPGVEPVSGGIVTGVPVWSYQY